MFFKYVIWLLTSIPLLSTDSWIFCLKYRSHSFPPSANWLFPLFCSIPSSTLLDFVWGMARVPRFFLPVKTFFSCTSLPICWPSRGHLLCTWYIHTYCCSRACCIPTYTLQGLSLKLQVRAEPHLNLACSACYFYFKNIPVWHCSLFAHVLFRVKCLLLWKYFVSVQKYLYIFCLFWIFLSTFVIPWKYIFFFLFSILRTTFEAIYF